MNTTWQYKSAGTGFSKWPNDPMVALMKHAGFLCTEEEAAEKDER